VNLDRTPAAGNILMMKFAIKLVLIGCVLAGLAACESSRSVSGGGSENNQSVIGRIGSVFKF